MQSQPQQFANREAYVYELADDLEKLSLEIQDHAESLCGAIKPEDHGECSPPESSCHSLHQSLERTLIRLRRANGRLVRACSQVVAPAPPPSTLPMPEKSINPFEGKRYR